MSRPAVPELDPAAARARLDAGECTFVDVRDPDSYRHGHVPGALHVTDRNVAEFCETADRTRPVIVYCYHGHSSLGGAAYFLKQGFQEVYSMSGGFTEWAREHPVEAAEG